MTPTATRMNEATTTAAVPRFFVDAALRADATLALPADVARHYVDGFPAMNRNAEDLAQIFAAAQGHHVQLTKGEYQLKADPGAAFVVYTATFPLHGDYDAIKGFSADVLDALPHVAMDELHLSRDNAGSTALDAVVRFTFYYRSL